MKPASYKSLVVRVAVVLTLFAVFYGIGRIYYHLTDGFTQENILSDLAPDPRWSIAEVPFDKKMQVKNILNQHFRYLGKGCQSYVFESADGQYVIKFFKYHRYRTKPWVNALKFVPTIETYRKGRMEHKNSKLDNLFTSWLEAYNSLSDQTGLIYVHLNKGEGWDQEVVLYDKLGLTHKLNVNQVEFLIQKKATMLADALDLMFQNRELNSVRQQIASLFSLIRSDYASGFTDDDHALLQNTGVLGDNTIHIDVGQIFKRLDAQDLSVYRQHLFNKMYKFREWLKEKDVQSALYTTALLFEQVGPDMWSMQPHFMH